MTATLDRVLTEQELDAELLVTACECERPDHHPGHGRCDQTPIYAARVRHVERCNDAAVYHLCQDCLDEALEWASGLIGAYCANCLKKVVAVSDLVGPVRKL